LLGNQTTELIEPSGPLVSIISTSKLTSVGEGKFEAVKPT